MDAGEALKKPLINRAKLLSASTLNGYRPVITYQGTFDELRVIKSQLNDSMCENGEGHIETFDETTNSHFQD